MKAKVMTEGAGVGCTVRSLNPLNGAQLTVNGGCLDLAIRTDQSGDYLFAMRAGAIGPDHIRAEVGELLLGTQPGRSAPDAITLFKSLGLAIEDLAAADYAYRQAQARGVGTWVEF